MEHLDLLRQFDGKALIAAIAIWAAVFNAWRAFRWKRAWHESEMAYTALALENVTLRSKRNQSYPDLDFTCAPEMYK